MAQINVVAIIGKDPEIKFFDTFSVAYTPREKSKSGEWSDGETTWFKVSIAGKSAEAAVDQFKKGDRVVVTGKLKISSYIDKAGAQKQGLEIRADSVGIIPKVEKSGRSTTKQTGEDFEW